MIKTDSKEECCGCTACFNVCNNDAICMQKDHEGFLYPIIDKEKCNECGLCEKVCPILSEDINNIYESKIYASINKDQKQYTRSSSGGIFKLLIDYVIEYKGVIYGACYNEKFNVIHKKAETALDAEIFYGSKYTQSELNNIFKEIKNYLINKRFVLFSGTPCQVKGLKLFLRKEYDNLVTCDIICHGVPSPRLFNEYLNFIKGRKSISYINMKHKIIHEKGTRIFIKFTDGKYKRGDIETDIWNKIYFNHFALRPICHKCKYTNLNRVGDITIGDFWHLDKIKPDFANDSKSYSLVIVNSIKGDKIWNNIKYKTKFCISTFEECKQPQLERPSNSNVNRDEFWKYYTSNGFKKTIRKFCEYNILNISKDRISKFIK